ncbi:ComEC/Rec2 family competence protein [Rhodococcus phenolicus]|uniref:ComEC/Rec2 family competence protein n=1 Tax=Rhodococcus phenolicus TaxID=263849 RepID=UPI00082A7C61|nr:ComEC/Rec2 family competence protein [Rhodococcus phenolicus]
MNARLDARLVPCAAAAWSATLVGLYAGRRTALVVSVIAVVLAGAAAVARTRGSRTVRTVAGPLLAALLVGAGFGVAAGVRAGAAETHPLAVAAARGAGTTAEVVLDDDPKPLRQSAFGGAPQVRIPASLRAAQIGRDRIVAGGSVVLFAPADTWSTLVPGQRITVRGVLAVADGPGLEVALIRTDGPPRAVAPPPPHQRWAATVRERLASAAHAVLPAEAAGLLPGLIVGDTSNLPDAVREEFRVAGLAHLTAVSGANVSILLGAVLLLVRGLGIGPRTGTALAALALVAFVVVVRPSPSVLRAAAMGSVALLALVVGRRRQAMPALAASIGVLLILAPGLAADAGFALSVVATAGLIAVAPGWVTRLRARGCPRSAAEVCAVSAAAFVVTAPIVAALSGTVSVVAIVANVLVALVLPPLTVLGSLIVVCGAAWPPAAELLARGAAPMLWWLLEVAERSASLPTAELTVPSGAAGAATVGAGIVGGWLVVRRRRLRRVVVVAALAAAAVCVPVWIRQPGWPGTGWAVVGCDVGQGDSFVLSAGDGGAVVVDTGPDPVAVDRCLRRLRVTRIPLLMITHLHADHVGGLEGVLTDRSVGVVVTGPGATTRPGGADLAATARRFSVPVRETNAGEVFTVGTITLRVLGAGPGGGEENDRSLVARAETPIGSVLLTGDAEAESQEALLRSGVDVRADVLKVPHHGSRTSSSRFLTAVRPRVALIGVGRDNPFGHPHAEILATLQNLGARVLGTDELGDIAVVRAGSGALAVVSDHRGTIGP